MDKHLTLTADEADAFKDDYDPLKKTPIEKYPRAKKEKKSSLALLLISAILFLLILFATGGSFLFYQIFLNLKTNTKNFTKISFEKPVQVITVTPKNPTEWNTYNGPINFTTFISPFSFKYPPNWQYAPSLSHQEKNYIEEVVANDTSDLSQRYILTIDTIKNSSSTLKEFIAKHQGAGAAPNLSFQNFVKDKSISIPVTDWLIDRGTSENNTESVILMKGSTVVFLTCANCTDEVTNKLISSFKFNL